MNPEFMKEIFYLKQHNHHMRSTLLEYQNPSTVTYGLESFGYKATQLWNSIPREIQEVKDVSTFKRFTFKNSSKFVNATYANFMSQIWDI